MSAIVTNRLQQRFTRLLSRNWNGNGKQTRRNYAKDGLHHEANCSNNAKIKSKWIIGVSVAIGLYGYHHTMVNTPQIIEADSRKEKALEDLNPKIDTFVDTVDLGHRQQPTYLAIEKPVTHSIADVAESTLPAVVYIETTPKHGSQPAAGSGFFITKDGLVLTNAHVVFEKMSINVRTSDGKTYEDCHVEAIDTNLDLATVRVPLTSSVSFMKLGKSSRCRPGEVVVAVGSPHSLTNTVTSGIISSMKRKLSDLRTNPYIKRTGLSSAIDYIQTDASINPGNSGGPLIDLKGEVIGINSIRATEGIALAIPSDVAMKFLNDVYGDDLSSCPTISEIKRERKSDDSSSFGSESNQAIEQRDDIEKPKLKKSLGISDMIAINGTTIREIIDKNPRLGHLAEKTYGVLIRAVTPSSPASIAGLDAGDVIIEIDGNKITSSYDVYKCLEIDDDDTNTIGTIKLYNHAN